MHQFMHNGGISDFHLIKRKLQSYIPDEIFDAVQGNTGSYFPPRLKLLIITFIDSEWAFALFLSKGSDPISAKSAGNLNSPKAGGP